MKGATYHGGVAVRRPKEPTPIAMRCRVVMAAGGRGSLLRFRCRGITGPLSWHRDKLTRHDTHSTSKCGELDSNWQNGPTLIPSSFSPKIGVELERG